MITQKTQSWQQANKAYLVAHLERLRRLLQEAGAETGDATGTEHEQTGEQFVMAHEEAAALNTLCVLFHLSPFERDLLLLCASIELESEFAALCAEAQGDLHSAYPTFSLALALLPGAYWEALTPGAPLRYWQLLEVEESHATLTRRALRIDERILHYLVGASYLDERLTDLFQPFEITAQPAPSQQRLAETIATTWQQSSDREALPIIQLCGYDLQGKRQIAAFASALVGYHICSLSVSTLPTGMQEAAGLLHLWEREALLSRQVLFLHCDDLEAADSTHLALATRLLERYHWPLIVSSRERQLMPTRPLLTFDVRKPTQAEQLALWREALDEQAALLNGSLQHLTSYFQLTGSSIRSISTHLRSSSTLTEQAEAGSVKELEMMLWEQCRLRARPRLDHLAQRIEAEASWQDLVLPELQCELLRDIAMQVCQRSRVYDAWGFRGKSTRGLGISALFAGASGTGKTLAAEVLAHELQLDLYRIDLSAVVSKYIGETEKNLRQIFDAAEESSVILLFDEADALFGKRGEVKDSHDRYANIQVSCLLQRMEVYYRLAILTTNMKDTLDTAFLRRIRFIVQFPFPDAAQRAEIWRRVFPPRRAY